MAASILAIPSGRIWRYKRSQAWSQLLLNGELWDREFEATFRMTKNSFNQLHALLGKHMLVFLN